MATSSDSIDKMMNSASLSDIDIKPFNNTPSFTLSPLLLRFPTFRSKTHHLSLDYKSKEPLALKISHDLPKDAFLTNIPKELDTDRKPLFITYTGKAFEEIHTKTFSVKFEEVNTNASAEVSIEMVYCSFPCLGCQTAISEEDQHVPMPLDCKHIICKSCLDESSKSTFGLIGMTKCPLCKTLAPRPRSPIHGVVNFIRKENNNDAIKMIELRELSAWNLDPKFPCHEDPSHESDWHCFKCEADYCHLCFVDNHINTEPIMSTHEAWKMKDRPSVILPRCHYHSDTFAVHICQTAECPLLKQVYCVECSRHHKHPQHHSVVYVANTNKTKLIRLEESLRAVETQFEKGLDMFLTWKSKYEEDKVTHMAKLQTKKGKDAFLECETTINQISSSREEFLLLVKTQSGQIRSEISQVVKQLHDFHKVDDLINRAEQFSCLLVNPNKNAELFHVPYTFPEDDTTEPTSKIPKSEV